ncbi:hypothetical protein ISG33_11295 [Glaciecola sp. MH2013]|uniref:hypothetical protein n=1 Tax=Glaciecola sp. MH2013 TaxID=2785524 RepID=UPI00189CB444|nr:hypothetical protein [Glaciecola sp. MH2013]MBF7073985.1 hypothetical protein [Glaciecola sp. MH2013]
MARSIYVILVLFLLGCSPDNQSSQNILRGETNRALNECYQISDDNINYKTAAKFSLSVPSWALNLPLENEFTDTCEITSLKLHFAYINEKLVLMPHPGIKHPNNINFPKFFDTLTLYLNFRDPQKDNYGDAKSNCDNKKPIYEYPEFGFRMCPYLTAQKNENVQSLPFYPKFETMSKRVHPTSLTCRHEDLSGYTIDNVFDMHVPYSCRGYWYWREGSSGTFDISKGQVLKKFSNAMSAAEVLLNSWVVNET